MTQSTPRDAVTVAWEGHGRVNDALLDHHTPDLPAARIPGGSSAAPQERRP